MTGIKITVETDNHRAELFISSNDPKSNLWHVYTPGDLLNEESFVFNANEEPFAVLLLRAHAAALGKRGESGEYVPRIPVSLRADNPHMHEDLLATEKDRQAWIRLWEATRDELEALKTTQVEDAK